MKCAVLSSVGHLDIVERETPACSEFDVLVKVECCGVCRTDRKAFNMGQRDLVLPRVLGHEIAGTVAAVGSGVRSYAPGDRVAVSPGVFCGTCEYCGKWYDNLCDKMRIIGFHLDGGFAEYLLVPGIGKEPPILNKMPDRMDFATAALAEPVACALNILGRLDIGSAKSAAVFGAGPLGMLTASLINVMSGAEIIIVEPMSCRRELADLVSDRQIDADEHTAARILEITRGRGVDVVIPCCPGNAPFATALSVAAKRGRVGFFSGLTDSEGLTNSTLNLAHYRELSIAGAYGCSLSDTREALEILPRLDIGGLPSLNVSWDELEGTVAQLAPYNHIFTYFIPEKPRS